jgi:OsmC-like protein
MDDGGWTLRVRATDADRATVYVRRHRFAVGTPAQFDEAYDEVTAVEYALAAVGGDLVNGFRRAARRRRLPIAEVEAVVGGALGNPLVYLGVVGETGNPGLARVTARVYVSTEADEAAVEQAWAEALERSPLVHALRPGVDLDLRLALV